MGCLCARRCAQLALPPLPVLLQEKLKTGAKPSVSVNFVSGTVAAVAATLITQPADVVRTRMQLGLRQAQAATAAAAQPGSMALLRQILAAQGARGLLTGALPRILKRTLQTALVWTLYEELFPLLNAVAQRARVAVT